MEDNTGINTEQGVQNNNGAQGAQNENGTGANGANGTQGNGGQNENLSEFDKFLQGEGMQAEFDRRVAKALATQKGKLSAETKTQIDAAVAEALKVAKMTKEEQAQHEAQKRADDLTKREQAILKRELQAKAKETLIEKGLPVSLADTINYVDEDSVTASIDALEKAFQTSVQSAVEEKLKGAKPPKKADNNSNATLEEQIAQAMKNGFFG